MANKIFLRVGAWYRASAKYIPDDIEITPLVETGDAQYPEIDDDLGGGGSVSIPETAYATNAEAVDALGVGVIYKTTTVLSDGIAPILSITV